jgi:hypothetical protein
MSIYFKKKTIGTIYANKLSTNGKIHYITYRNTPHHSYLKEILLERIIIVIKEYRFSKCSGFHRPPWREKFTLYSS